MMKIFKRSIWAATVAAFLASPAQAADIQSWSSTAGLNVLSSGTSGTGGVNTDEGMAPDLVNNAMRDMMARIASWRTGGSASGGFWGSTTIGHTAQLATFAVTAPFQVIGTSSLVVPRIAMAGFGANGQLLFYRSANTTIGSATVVASGDTLGEIKFGGAQQTATFSNSTVGAVISGQVDGTVTSGAGADMPGRLVFSTSADGTATPTERMRISNAGVLDLATGTSAGIKFPAAGMASADANTLDYYAEAQTTPTCTAASGTFTTVSCTVTYTRIGRQVMWNANIVITTNGTAAGYIVLPMPFTAGANAAVHGFDGSTNFSVTGQIAASTASALIFKYDGTYPGVSGHTLNVGGTFNL